jgi:6,7-dimethyl-8-ribityllumazine synthase
MATSERNLSSISGAKSDVSKKHVGIVVAEWNSEITESMYEACVKQLLRAGIKKENLHRRNVPGTFELSLGAQYIASDKNMDAVICIGCVINGETKHFDYICSAVSYGITEVSLKFNKPVIFGVLTTLNKQQALDRAGGKHGNKGDEAAAACLSMLSFNPL